MISYAIFYHTRDSSVISLWRYIFKTNWNILLNVVLYYWKFFFILFQIGRIFGLE